MLRSMCFCPSSLQKALRYGETSISLSYSPAMKATSSSIPWLWGSLRYHRWLCNQFSPVFPVLHRPPELSEPQACPFPDAVFLCLPFVFPPFTAPCEMALARPDEWGIWPHQCSTEQLCHRKTMWQPCGWWRHEKTHTVKGKENDSSKRIYTDVVCIYMCIVCLFVCVHVYVCVHIYVTTFRLHSYHEVA